MAAHGVRRKYRPGLAWLLGLCLASAAALVVLPARTAGAEPIFGPLLAGPPGPDHWFISQWYGNTVWAHQNREEVYDQGQGIHFGVDFATPCGTPVIAIGDGTVFAVDGPYGSAPHNLVIRHPNGLFSLYGHLLERPTIAVGTIVRKGDKVALSGDPAGERCDVEPHVHLEIRRAGMSEAVNPVPLIALDWDRAAIGLRRNGLRFEIDLDDPVPWTMPADQPDIVFGQRLINDFPRAWP
jgi:murein DD-endopeptidase MepM/ murein hydrolase activator NlpD